MEDILALINTKDLLGQLQKPELRLGSPSHKVLTTLHPLDEQNSKNHTNSDLRPGNS